MVFAPSSLILTNNYLPLSGALCALINMSRSWLKISWKIGALVFVVITAAYINYQRTTFGEVYAEKLLEVRNDLQLAAFHMKDGVSYAEFILPESSISKVNSGNGFKALEAAIYKVYCE